MTNDGKASNWFDVNTSGLNAKLLDSKLSPEDRQFIFDQITPYADTKTWVRVSDSSRMRRLLGITVPPKPRRLPASGGVQ